MQDAIPPWFQADQVYSLKGKWYVGSTDALQLGPYPNEKRAVARSEEITDCLRSLANEDQQLTYVKSLLSSEWHDIQRYVDPEVQKREAPVEKPRTFPVRDGEAPQHWTRSSRYFNVGSMWFFSTREGIDVGPFEHKKEAVDHCKTLLKSLQDLSEHQAFKLIFEYKHTEAAV